MICKKYAQLKSLAEKKQKKAKSKLLSKDLSELKYNERASHNLMTSVRYRYSCSNISEVWKKI